MKLTAGTVGGLLDDRYPLPWSYRLSFNNNYAVKITIKNTDTEFIRVYFYTSGYGALYEIVISKNNKFRKTIVGTPSLIECKYRNIDNNIEIYINANGGNIRLFSLTSPNAIEKSNIPSEAITISEN